MKRLKKITAILLALAMVFALGVNAFAAAVTPTFSITVVPNDDAEHTYEVYQIFAGHLDELDGKIVLSDIVWGNGVKFTETPDDLVDALKEVNLGTELEPNKPFEEKLTEISGGEPNYKYTAEDIATILNGLQNDSDAAQAFANIMNSYLAIKPSYEKSGITRQKDSLGSKYEANMAIAEKVPAGYYFIKDKTDSLNNKENEDGAYTDYILEVVENVNVESKSDVPHLSKNILGDDDNDGSSDIGSTEKKKENSVNVGDLILYELSSNVPDMAGYKTYFFVIKDTLSGGLTYKGDKATAADGGLTVKIGETTLNKGTKEGDDGDYYVEISPEPTVVGTPTQITIVFKNFLEKWKTHKGEDIIITYGAEINKAAIIGSEGNPNTADLEFSNNPNVDDNGDHDKPTKPHGKTPEEKVITYTSSIELKKVDKEGTTLEGAEFSIKGMSTGKSFVTGTHYEPADSSNSKAIYWKLKDGTYTTTEPVTTGEHPTVDLYDSETQKYELVEYAKEELGTSKEVALRAFVGEDGILKFQGLNEGYYVIVEEAAPEGYNKLKKAYGVQIRATFEDDGTCKWEYRLVDDLAVDATIDMAKEALEALESEDSGGWKPLSDDSTNDPTITNGVVKIDVINKKGIELPETGGIGTTIFYIVGGGLLIAALAVLVSKILGSSKKSKKTSAAAQNI